MNDAISFFGFDFVIEVGFEFSSEIINYLHLLGGKKNPIFFSLDILCPVLNICTRTISDCSNVQLILEVI